MAYIDSNATFVSNWARRLAIKNIYEAVGENVSQGHSLGIPDVLLESITHERLPRLETPVLREPTDATIQVGIIGAGSSGLFTGMVIDFLNQNVDNLNIDYQILEAAEENRLGGRLFTYNFHSNSNGHQYYDVGAMRFPKNPIMKRVFQLFDLLGMKETPHPGPNAPIGCLIPYYYQGLNSPWQFNDRHFIGLEPWKASANTFGLTGDIPFLHQDPSKVFAAVTEPFKQLIKQDIEHGAHNGPGWEKLTNSDRYSTRDYLLWWNKIDREEKAKSNPSLKVPTRDGDQDGYSFDTVSWLETFNAGTHWYNQAFSETVLEAMDFNETTEASPQIPSDQINWWCVNGGAGEIAKRMTDRLKNKPIYNSTVAKISQTAERKLAVNVTNGNLVGIYDAVINSTTLGAMQRMDLTQAGLNYGTKQAIRTLSYSASCKIGIQFDRPWWISDCKVSQGGLGHTDLPIRTCVYPSYNLYDDQTKDAVLLCTYNWDGDAQRLGSMIGRNSPEDDSPLLKSLLLRDLALLHSTPQTYDAVYQMISRSYKTHHAHDWFADSNYAGAFAYFGPGQFAGMWPDMVTPSSDGNLIIIGEHASAHHAWVVGALESAVRGVWQVLHRYSGSITNSDKAMRLLEDPESAPFGPLPLESQPETMQWQNIVARTRNEKIKQALSNRSRQIGLKN